MTSKPDQTVTVGIDRDEWYPVFSLVEAGATYARTREIPADLAKRAKRALKAFDEVQGDLAEYFHEGEDD